MRPFPESWTINTNAIAIDRPTIREDRTIQSDLLQPSFWLGGAHDIEANGQFDVRLCPYPTGSGWTLLDIRSDTIDSASNLAVWAFYQGNVSPVSLQEQREFASLANTEAESIVVPNRPISP